MLNRDTGKLIPLVAGAKTVVCSPRCAPWQHLRLEQFGVPPFENPEIVLEREHLISMNLSSSEPLVEWLHEGKFHSHAFREMELSLLPLGPAGRWRSGDQHECIVATIGHDFIVDVALEGGLSSYFEVVSRVPFFDSFLASCLVQLRDEVRDGFPGGALYGDSITAAMAMHLLTRYSSNRRLQQEAGGRLDRSKLKDIIDFIKENSNTDLSLSDLAAFANLSPNHFLRLFKAATSLTPHQYLIRYRIQLGRKLLLPGNLSVKQVARQVGFCDASHFARYFKRIMQISPHQFTKLDGGDISGDDD